MAVEPQMQRRWEEQLAGYVAASFRVTSLGNTASQLVQFVSKLVTAAILYFGAKLVIGGDLVGRRTRRLQHPRRSGLARRCCGWRSSGRISIRRGCRSSAWATSSTPRPSRPTVAARAALPAIRGDIAFEHVTFRYRVDGPEILHDISLRCARRTDGRHRRAVGLGQEHARQAGAAALSCRRAGAC